MGRTAKNSEADANPEVSVALKSLPRTASETD